MSGTASRLRSYVLTEGSGSAPPADEIFEATADERLEPPSGRKVEVVTKRAFFPRTIRESSRSSGRSETTAVGTTCLRYSGIPLKGIQRGLARPRFARLARPAGLGALIPGIVKAPTGTETASITAVLVVSGPRTASTHFATHRPTPRRRTRAQRGGPTSTAGADRGA